MRRIWPKKDKDREKEKRKSLTGNTVQFRYSGASNGQDSLDYERYSAQGPGSGSGADLNDQGGRFPIDNSDQETTADPEFANGIGANRDEDDVVENEDAGFTKKPRASSDNISNSSSVTTAKTDKTIKKTVKLPSSPEIASVAAIKGPKSISGLIKYDYDNKILKHSWANVVINTSSVPEVSDQTLRLFRIELRGSHLYLYRHNNLSIKNFKLNSPDNIKDDLASLTGASMMSTKNDLDLVSISGPKNVSTSNISAPSNISGPTNISAPMNFTRSSNISSPIEVSGPLPSSASVITTTTLGTSPTRLAHSSSQDQNTLSSFQPPDVFKNSNNSNNSLPESQHSANSGSTAINPHMMSNNAGQNDDDYAITYFETTIPHPDLNFDYSSLNFLSGCTMELIIHFCFFQYDSNYQMTINQVLAILPVYPELGKTLRLMEIFLSHLFNDKFNGDHDLSLIVERVSYFLDNIHDNFKGFLLKSDIAPYILKILELLNSHLDEKMVDSSLINGIKSFKAKMLSSQQNLINLVAATSGTNVDVNPFQDLNANYFLNHVNLIEFASTISAIDLTFFNEWNSNIDKSLLLYTTINQNGSTDFFYKKNPLFFNNEFHIHYLSRLLINHLFLETPLTSLNCSTALLEFKARLLEKWIDLGCLLDKSGNMSSWLGIVSIVLSQPILRLTKIWSFVSPDYIKLLKNDWSPVLFELDRRFLVNGVNVSASNTPNPQRSAEEGSSLDQRDSYHIMVPRGLGKIYPKERVIPYFGDLIISNAAVSSISELEAIYKRINYSFTRWNEYLSNLTNHNEIIKYNDDVLKRYDSMGFIFSNESLNQVLYLGLNNDESKPLPQSFEITNDNLLITNVNESLKMQLLKVIELNTESTNLEKLMMLSLSFEPELPESYLRPSINNFYRNFHSNHSNISINSNDSSASLPNNSETTSASLNNISLGDFNLTSRLPIFNNNYFKINLSKYDELTLNNGGIINIPNENDTGTGSGGNKHNIPISKTLVFRIDDFVNDIDNQNSDFNALDDVDNEDDDEDVPGLGINVDDILNSDKFNNLSVNSDSSAGKDSNNSPHKKSGAGIQGQNSYSVVSSESSQLQIYKYIPKYASVDRLVDMLIIDSKFLEDSINIDLTEYRFVFLLNYSSFITTRELLDKLAHRFINSGNAVISIMKKLYLMKNNQLPDKYSEEFPNWSLDPTIDLNNLGEVDYSLLLKIQINILKVLVVLINNFYASFSMDLFNKRILIKLLKLFSNEILQWYNSNKIDSNLEKPFESLVNYYKKLKKLFVKKTYRPFEVLKFDHFLITEFKFSNSLHEVPMNRNLPGHKNVNKIEKFLHKFNKLLTAFYKGCKTEDWFRVYKILEIEFEKNNLLEFNLQRTNTPDEALVISNIFDYFDSLNDPDEKVLTQKKFPLVFRKLFKLYSKFKTYILVQLTDLNITVDERLDRMKTLLYMVKICQLKMSENQFVFDGKGRIPSCIETAITQAIYSPESRLFTNLWIKASASLNHSEDFSYESLNLLLPKDLNPSHLIIQHEPLLPCFGWIIENLMEINKCPNFNNKSLINFNKRYLVFKLLKELTVEDIESSEELSHNDTREFEFLLKLDENLVNNQNIKEFNLLERDKAKLFRNVLKDQHKILLLDNRKKQMREGKDQGGNNSHHQHSNNSISGAGSTSNSLGKKPSNSSMRRQSLTYKSNTSTGSRFKFSGLFNRSRPFSLTSGNNVNQQHSDRCIDAKDLPNVDSVIDGKQKAVVVIPLKNKKIFPVYLLPLSFKIDGELGGDDFFFQCADDDELHKWLLILNYANRHWFFSRSLNAKNQSSYTTFGIPLSVVCNRHASLVPNFLVGIFNEIEKEGLNDVGIYRISTSLSELNNLKSMIDKVGYVDFKERSYDTHALTSCVKSFLRELPDSLLTDKVIEKLFQIRQKLTNEEIDQIEMIAQFKFALKALPLLNFETLKLLMHHLQQVCLHQEKNKMTPANMATVIGPALTEASNLAILVNNFGFMNFITEKLIVNYERIFEKEMEDVKKEIEAENTSHEQSQDHVDAEKGSQEENAEDEHDDNRNEESQQLDPTAINNIAADLKVDQDQFAKEAQEVQEKVPYVPNDIQTESTDQETEELKDSSDQLDSMTLEPSKGKPEVSQES